MKFLRKTFVRGKKIFDFDASLRFYSKMETSISACSALYLVFTMIDTNII